MNDFGGAGTHGGFIQLASGKVLVDYDMDGGRVLVGHRSPEIEAVRLTTTRPMREPFDEYAHVLARSVEDAEAVVASVRAAHGPGLVVSDESVHFGRVEPPGDWDLRLVGRAAAAGADFAAVLARDRSLLEAIDPPAPPEPAAVAVAEAVVRLAGPLVVHQLAGRSERLAFGIAEVAAGAGIRVDPVQPGGWFELRFEAGDRDRGVPERFAAEMRSRGFLVPAEGPWWPCLAHDYFTIERTVDAAAAAMAAAR